MERRKDENPHRSKTVRKRKEHGRDQDKKPKLRARKTKSTGTRVTQKRKLFEEPQEQRLNKYISNSGVCSRRQADVLIAEGRVTVNGKVVDTLGSKVLRSDTVKLDGRTLSLTEKVYIVLNKPKNHITTTHDPEGRKTVMDLVQDVDAERIYPVGRLDRNTTGILLFTNDGQLSQRLIHPKKSIKKVYGAELDRPLTKEDFNKILEGVELEDGMMAADKLAYVDPKDETKIGIEIHSGRNRIIHRMFESLGYTVEKLDRVIFAGLDKQRLGRGKWRNLTEKELRQLKTLVGIA